jgi:hypothetical protein
VLLQLEQDGVRDKYSRCGALLRKLDITTDSRGELLPWRSMGERSMSAICGAQKLRVNMVTVSANAHNTHLSVSSCASRVFSVRRVENCPRRQLLISRGWKLLVNAVVTWHVTRPLTNLPTLL